MSYKSLRIRRKTVQAVKESHKKFLKRVKARRISERRARMEIPTAPPTPTPNIHGRTLRRHETFYFEAPTVQVSTEPPTPTPDIQANTLHLHDTFYIQATTQVEIPTAPPTPTPDIQGRNLRRHVAFYFQTPPAQVLIPTEPPTPRYIQGKTLRRHEQQQQHNDGEISLQNSTLPEVPPLDLSLEQFLGQRIKLRRINPLMAQVLGDTTSTSSDA